MRTQGVTKFNWKHNKESAAATKKRRKREEVELSKNEAIVTWLFDCMVRRNECLKGLLNEFANTKELMNDYVRAYGKILEIAITLKSSEGLNTTEHKGVYHLPSSSSQVVTIVNLD
ncbi:hypothetical protein Pmani_032000 [Petrolisthes manimaculis]|uniref:Uncharacterized protein n=1 Tax=Petrolisthes manimaculis TaxID=1843537 RepID=A0AAE1TU76_9EUCA|nr:hypothetical protein Pmani_032000 [Petrolisthes manimaculis]